MARGVVKFFKEEKGWGAIASGELPDGQDAWVHFSVIESDGYRALRSGDVVDFDFERVRQDSFGFRATRARRIAPGPAPTLRRVGERVVIADDGTPDTPLARKRQTELVRPSSQREMAGPSDDSEGLRVQRHDERVPVTLRLLTDADLDALFGWEREPRAVRMAAFTRPDPSDRASFDAHYQRIRADPAVTLRAVDDGGGLVGTIGSFTMDGDREITYWIDPARWGEGLASAALGEFLRIETRRPLFAPVAEHNTGSAKVLARAGFTRIGSETSFANGVGREIVEHIYELAR